MAAVVLIMLIIFMEGVCTSPIRRSALSNLPEIISLLVEEQHLQLNQMQRMENTSNSYASALPDIVSVLSEGYLLQAKQTELLDNVSSTATAALPEIVHLLDKHSRQLENISVVLDKLEQTIAEAPSLITNYLKLRENASNVATSIETSARGDTLPDIIARDCSDLAAQGPYTSGPYVITPSDELGPFKVWCDMDTEGGGWTVFQKRFDGSVDFFQGWEDYKKGFGNVDSGEYWLGLTYIDRLTSSGQSWELRIDLTDFTNDTSFAHYANFAIGDESTLFRLTLGCYDGTAKDAMRENNNLPFSTKDRDHDIHQGFSCAENRQGAWWYEACTYSNLNGLYLRPSMDSPRAMYWHKWKERPEALKRSEMKIRPIK